MKVLHTLRPCTEQSLKAPCFKLKVQFYTPVKALVIILRRSRRDQGWTQRGCLRGGTSSQRLEPSCASREWGEVLGGGGGGTLIFSYIRRLRLRLFFLGGVKILNFNNFEGFQKNDILLGMKILWIILAVTTKLGYI